MFHRSSRNPVSAAALALCLVSLGAGCAYVHPQPPRHPGPYNEPVDAFDAVDVPDDPSRSSVGPQNNNLGGQLQRLHNAREVYNRDQERQAAELRREQAACRANPDAKKVTIQDGTNDPEAVYCHDD